LLAPEVDAELARRQAASGDDGEQMRLDAVRQVLEVCREHGSTAPLHDSMEEPEQPDGERDVKDASPELAFVSVALKLEQSLAEDGVLRASLDHGDDSALCRARHKAESSSYP